ncbi:MAG: hypothetical protein K1Y01_09990 [Vicinamibacteria bacterium]|nr:hypothetical protein [Vicinamibacteria bacterium]
MERNNQRLVIALASALGVALLVIAFLLGRVSTAPAVVTVTAPAPSTPTANAAPPKGSVEAQPGPAEVGVEAGPAAAPPLAATPSLVDTPVPAPVALAATPPGSRAMASPDQAQIAAYFNQVDRIGDMGGGDPQAFATSLIQSMSSGDFSGFDDLLAKARAQRQRLQSISPPRACVEHHRLALALSSDSVAMLERLKAALVKGDSTALLAMASEGKTLEAQANQLKAMGETIRRQAGL